MFQFFNTFFFFLLRLRVALNLHQSLAIYLHLSFYYDFFSTNILNDDEAEIPKKVK